MIWRKRGKELLSRRTGMSFDCCRVYTSKYPPVSHSSRNLTLWPQVRLERHVRSAKKNRIHTTSRTSTGGGSQSPYHAARMLFVRSYSNAGSHPSHRHSKTLGAMRIDILAGCMIACASSSLAAPLPIDPPKGGACPAPSRPDHKVNAYPAIHLTPVTAIGSPEPPNGPVIPNIPQQEPHGAALVLPELHRKITVHDEFRGVDG